MRHRTTIDLIGLNLAAFAPWMWLRFFALTAHVSRATFKPVSPTMSITEAIGILMLTPAITIPALILMASFWIWLPARYFVPTMLGLAFWGSVVLLGDPIGLKAVLPH